MLYIQQGFKTHDMNPVNESLQDLLNAWEPSRINLTAETLADYKSTSALYAFSGELKDNTRNNGNVIYRDAVALDLDFLASDINDRNIYNRLKELLGRVEWFLYPSISNGFKGVRYRLVIPVSHHLENATDYKTVIDFLNDRFLCNNLLVDVDNSNKTWSQVFGLPVCNQFYPCNLDIVRKNQGQPFPTAPDTLRWMQSHTRDNKQDNNARQRLPSTNKSGHYKTYTARLLNEFVAGIGEGQRNNKMLELASFLVGIGFNDINAMYDFMQVMNVNYLVPPLPDKEIASTLRSALKRSTAGVNHA